MWSLYALTILAGLANAIQPGQNATLSKSLGLPVTAALLTLLVRGRSRVGAQEQPEPGPIRGPVRTSPPIAVCRGSLSPRGEAGRGSHSA